MLCLLNKATCEVCGEEIRWWPENHGRFSPCYIEAVKESPDICIANVLREAEDSINYRIHCNYCHNEIQVTMKKDIFRRFL